MRATTFQPNTEGGFTLVEAIIALVILAAAVAGVLLVFAGPMASSADPMVRAQARAIASGYMDEILLREYGGDSGAGSRDLYTTIGDYHGLDDQPPENQFGDPLAELSDYRVRVDIDPATPPAGGDATITVRVSHDSGLVDYDLVSDRGDY